MVSERKFSILIPTRSRSAYLRDAIDTSLLAGMRAGRDFEIVVADNASDDDTPLIREEYPSPHVKWYRSDQRLSMRANFQRALDVSTGTHICFIGDDDGLNIEGLAYLDRLLDASDALVVQWPQLNYTWPVSGGGQIKVRYSAATGLYSAVDTELTIRKIRDADFFDYHVGANIYHGCVARSLIHATTAGTDGPYFHAVVPDVYAAMHNLFFAKGRMVRAQFPVSIGGASPRSNGADSQKQGGNDGSGEFRKFIAESLEDKVQSMLPADCRSISMITLDALLHVCRRHGFSDDFNVKAWWHRIKPEILGQSAENFDRHIAMARDLFDDQSLGRDLGVPRSSPATSPLAPSSSGQVATRRKVGLTSVALTGGPDVRTLRAAADYVDRLVVGGRPVLPTRSFVAHGMRVVGSCFRASRGSV